MILFSYLLYEHYFANECINFYHDLLLLLIDIYGFSDGFTTLWIDISYNHGLRCRECLKSNTKTYHLVVFKEFNPS